MIVTVCVNNNPINHFNILTLLFSTSTRTCSISFINFNRSCSIPWSALTATLSSQYVITLFLLIATITLSMATIKLKINILQITKDIQAKLPKLFYLPLNSIPKQCNHFFNKTNCSTITLGKN